jgi:hypothetical protein
MIAPRPEETGRAQAFCGIRMSEEKITFFD